MTGIFILKPGDTGKKPTTLKKGDILLFFPQFNSVIIQRPEIEHTLLIEIENCGGSDLTPLHFLKTDHDFALFASMLAAAQGYKPRFERGGEINELRLFETEVPSIGCFFD